MSVLSNLGFYEVILTFTSSSAFIYGLGTPSIKYGMVLCVLTSMFLGCLTFWYELFPVVAGVWSTVVPWKGHLFCSQVFFHTLYSCVFFSVGAIMRYLFGVTALKWDYGPYPPKREDKTWSDWGAELVKRTQEYGFPFLKYLLYVSTWMLSPILLETLDRYSFPRATYAYQMIFTGILITVTGLFWFALLWFVSEKKEGGSLWPKLTLRFLVRIGNIVFMTWGLICIYLLHLTLMWPTTGSLGWYYAGSPLIALAGIVVPFAFVYPFFFNNRIRSELIKLWRRKRGTGVEEAFLVGEIEIETKATNNVVQDTAKNNMLASTYK
jgi:hypothetical protein